MAGPPLWSARIRAERKARKWDIHTTARRLRAAAGPDRHDLPEHTDLVRAIRRWESGKIKLMSERYRLLYSVIFEMDENTLFTATAEIAPFQPPMDADTDLGRMSSLREADRRIGGGHLYPTVIGYLEHDIAPRLFSAADGRHSFMAAAAFTEMAGWMAHDGGKGILADRHFHRALDFAELAGDPQLQAHILGSMSQLARHLGHPHDAVGLAQRGIDTLTKSKPAAPTTHARLLAVAAYGSASLGNGSECARLLIRAEDALRHRPQHVPSAWIGPYDEATLALDTARSMLLLGELAEAQRQARRFLKLRSTDRTRSRAFGQLVLAKTLLKQDQLDEACTLITNAAQDTRSLSSLLVTQQLADLHEQLQARRDQANVADCLEVLEHAHRERCWMYQ
ncbi:hypothetical protein [Nonomuraea basaltis]|uniref:hypothetical protein n=1 Tax=Nonomuraea basaltis TaxID=2495887 RepID=UPI00110C5A1A|nr:hypothetical protein [Nonomuraea basaltis]TMR96813.1 hypothetical protein EJK15_21150 [Nonomuraea basaltis]